MCNENYRVWEKSLSCATEPVMIAERLSYRDAWNMAQGLLFDFISKFGCPFMVTCGNGEFQAVRQIDDLYSWGARYYIERE